MRPLLVALAAVAFGQLALADDAADRAAINTLFATLNDRTASHDQLYTADSGDSRRQIERISGEAATPMSEVTRPFVVANAVRFITPDVALVDAVNAQYGSLNSRRVPLLIVLRKTRTWQIAAVRVQPNAYPGLGNFLVDSVSAPPAVAIIGGATQ